MQFIEIDPLLEKYFVQCIAQVTLVNITSSILQLFYDNLSEKTVQEMLKQHLEKSNKFAKDFNSQLDLRLKLWRVGFMQAVENLPGLVAQEYRSLNVIISVYFNMYYESQKMNGEADVKLTKVLFETCSRVLKDYVLK